MELLVLILMLLPCSLLCFCCNPSCVVQQHKVRSRWAAGGEQAHEEGGDVCAREGGGQRAGRQ